MPLRIGAPAARQDHRDAPTTCSSSAASMSTQATSTRSFPGRGAVGSEYQIHLFHREDGKDYMTSQGGARRREGPLRRRGTCKEARAGYPEGNAREPRGGDCRLPELFRARSESQSGYSTRESKTSLDFQLYSFDIWTPDRLAAMYMSGLCLKFWWWRS